jgi:hypothetical protein
LAGSGGGAFEDCAGLPAAAGLAPGGTDAGAPVAPSGVPHRAQNLNVAAFKAAQFGHSRGGASGGWKRGPGLEPVRAGFCSIVGGSSCCGNEAPHERHEPTSVSFQAPHFGHSIQRF